MSGEAAAGDARAPAARRGAAFLVHIFTASGAVLGLLALEAASRRDFAAMFAWLGAALVVDGIDGTIARRLRVADLLPRWSGEALDLVVDFLTYVVVPAYALAKSGLLPAGLGLPAAALIVLTSALYFADRRMKTDDYYFRGFPAVWNAVAFYLFLLEPAPWLALASVVALAALTFVPVAFVHPFRVARLRALSLGLLAGWAALALWAIAADLRPPPWVTGGLVTAGLYFLLAGLLRHTARKA